MVERAIESKHDPNFALNWWKQAQKYNTILTKPVLRRKLQARVKELEAKLEHKGERKNVYKEQLNRILKKWQFGEVPFKNAEEFLEKFENWINEQLERKKNWKELLEKYEAKSLTELEKKLDLSEKNHQQYLEELQEKQEIEFKYKEIEKERKDWLTPYLSKIDSLEQQLVSLAKQKITNQKEASQLVKQLENNWNKDKEQWTSEFAKAREIIANLEKDKKDLLEQIKGLNSENDKLSKKVDSLVLDKNSLKEEIKEQGKDQKAKEQTIIGLNKSYEKLEQKSTQEKNDHQQQLKAINTLFDEKAENYETIDFNGLYALLIEVAERERERAKKDGGSKKKGWWEK